MSGGTGVDLKLASCTLAVHDVDEALGFYRDVLGFAVCDEAEFGGMGCASVGPPSQPDVQIFLQPPGADRMAKSLPSRLIFETNDCDATFEHLEAAGAEVMQEPITRPDGVRDCAFLDPSGNMLRFTQPRQTTHKPLTRQERAGLRG